MCRQLVLSFLSIYFRMIFHCAFTALSIHSEMIPNTYIDELIAENYIANVMRKWKMSTGSDEVIHADLKGLYNTLKYHPGLMERRLLVVGKNPPPLPKETKLSTVTLKKRSSLFDIGLAQPVCPFKTQWSLIYNAKDMNNTFVEVFQPSDEGSRQYQWFYTVSCDRQAMAGDPPNCPFCCRGIHSRGYASRCITRQSYVIALVRKPGEENYDWNYIQVDSSCNCAISPISHQ